MRAAAAKYGGDGANAETWAITGLLHDADYEQWPEEHPRRIVDWLKEQGEEEIAYAAAYHQTKWNLPPKTAMDKALVACDELAGFVIACSLVRPEGISTLEPKSVKKKLEGQGLCRQGGPGDHPQERRGPGRRNGRAHPVRDRRSEAARARTWDRW